MKQLQRKTITLAILISLLTLIGGFCWGNVASASTHTEMMPNMDMDHCGGQVSMLRQGLPINGAMMPCCIDRHDNVPTVLPHASQEKVKHFSALISSTDSESVNFVSQKTYVSSPSPPGRPDILSSVIKKE